MMEIAENTNKSMHKIDIMKKRIQLNEAQLKQIIKESIKNILSEVGDTPKGQNKLGRLEKRKREEGNDEEGNRIAKYARKEQDAAYRGDNFTTREKAIENGGKLVSAYLNGRDKSKTKKKK